MRYILYRVNSFLLYHSRHASVRVLMVITFKAPRGAIGGPLVLVSTISGAAGVHHGVTLSWQTKGVGDSHLLIHKIKSLAFLANNQYLKLCAHDSWQMMYDIEQGK